MDCAIHILKTVYLTVLGVAHGSQPINYLPYVVAYTGSVDRYVHAVIDKKNMGTAHHEHENKNNDRQVLSLAF